VETLLDRLHSPLIQSVLFDLWILSNEWAGQNFWKTVPLKAFARALTKHLDSLTEIVFHTGLSRHISQAMLSPSSFITEAETLVKEKMGYPIANIVKVERSIFNLNTDIRVHGGESLVLSL
jgi:hypothetical protein